MGVIELPDDVIIDIDGTEPGSYSEDWMKGLGGWPFQYIHKAAQMREKLVDMNTTVAVFRESILFNRWEDRIEWFSEI